MTPEAAVLQLAEILMTIPEPTQSKVYEAMVLAGVPGTLADRTDFFTQIAWGRFWLDKLGAIVSDEYVCLDRDGQIIESGHLSNEPSFVAARKLGPRYIDAKPCKMFALASSEVSVVSQALNAGDKAQHLVLGPACMITEELSDKGQENLLKIATPDTSAMRPQKSAAKTPDTNSKPWWRFW